MADSTLRSRVAARWAQAEGTVSRILLLTVFAVGLIAQFVKPVGDAMEGKAYIGGALLSLVGYVLYSEVQRLNSAHETQRDAMERLNEAHEAQREVMVGLGDTIRVLSEHVAEFGAAQRSAPGVQVTKDELLEEIHRELRGKENVQLAIMGFTGENTAPRLKQFLEALPPNPRREVTVRYLVPDFDKEIELPGLVINGKVGDAAAFRAYLRGKILGFESDLNDTVSTMRHAGQGTLNLEFRVLHTSPILKLHLINDDRLVEGIYDKVRRRPDRYSPPPAEGETRGELLDPIGDATLLTRWHWDDGPVAEENIRRRRQLFDDLWAPARPLRASSPVGPVPAPHTGD